MTEGPIDGVPDDDLVDDLAAAAALYPLGVMPGLHRVELVQATFTGFTAFQARAVLDDRNLMAWLHDYWRQHPPREVIRELADGATITAGLHRELLERHAGLAAEIERAERDEAHRDDGQGTGVGE